MTALALLLVASCGPGSRDTACAGCDTPAELLVGARLTASGIRPAEGHPWAREDEAGPGALRNDVSDDGWQPPEGEAAWLEVDLRPLVGSAELDELSATWVGAVPRAAVALGAGCGLPSEEVFDWQDPTSPLDLGGRSAGCLRLTVEGGADTVLTSLALPGRLQREPGWPDLQPPAPARSVPGLIEGFYGQPWSWRERARALWQIAVVGDGFYLYAPKDDPLHRDRWREPYDGATEDAFVALADDASSLGVALVFGISPFIDYDPDDPADYDALRDKLAVFLDLGVTGFALLADDIEMEADVAVDGALGAGHAEVANRLLADLCALDPGARLLFVPTVYSDDRLLEWEGAPAYLEALRALEPDIDVLWTGTGTFCAALEAADLAEVRTLLGRDPLLWDNLWANDIYDPFTGRVHLGLYADRADDLLGAVDGIGANPMVQGALSRLDLGLLVAWLAGSGDPRAAAAALETADERDQALLVQVMEAFDGTGLALPGHAGLAGVDLAADPLAAVDALLPLLASLAALRGAVHHSGLDIELVDELAYPLDKVRHEAQAGLWTLTLLGERLAGRDGGSARAAAEDELSLSADSRFVFSPGAVEGLLEAAVAVEVHEEGLAAPVTLPFGMPACVVGQPMRWRPFGGAAEVGVFGLAGAAVEGDAVRWEPPHAGTWAAVLTARSAAGGWAWQTPTLRCAPG